MNSKEQEVVCKDGVCLLKEHEGMSVSTQGNAIKSEGAVIEITAENFKAVVIHSKKPVIVDFNATWCPPCKMMKPIFAELAQEERDWVFASVDADKVPSIMQEYNVQALPTFMVFKDGKQWGMLKGALSKEQLLSEIKKIIATEEPVGPSQEERTQALLVAISQRKPRDVKAVIEQGADVNAVIEAPQWKFSPLQCAIITSTEEIIDILKDAGASMTAEIEDAAKNQINLSVNMLDTMERNCEYAQERIAALPEPIKQEVKKSGPEYIQQLMLSVHDEETLKNLIAEGVDINSPFLLGANEITVLCLAFMFDKKASIDMLIDAGASLDVEVLNDKGERKPLKDGIMDGLVFHRKGVERAYERLAHALKKDTK